MTDVRLRYETFEFADFDLHIRSLRDTQQFDDDDVAAQACGIDSTDWGIFGVLWHSSHALAHLMSDFDFGEKRILEVGCGIGLASLVLNHRDADITATDYHPRADTFLQANTKLNGDDPIPFVCTNWSESDPDLGQFDLIIGSDLLYQRDHVELLSAFIERHAQPNCTVILVGENRGHRGKFSKSMAELGYEHSRRAAGQSTHRDTLSTAKILSYERVA